jgi:hypothetical protein
MRRGDTHLAKVNVRELFVIVLSGMDKDRLNLRMALHFPYEWCDLRKIGTRPHDIDDFQALAHVFVESDGLLLVQPQTDVQVPGKLFEYICIGRPILALVPRKSAVEHILESAGVPYACIYTDDRLGDVDQKVLDFLSIPSRPTPYSDWFGNNFNGNLQAKQMAGIIEEISLSSSSLLL